MSHPVKILVNAILSNITEIGSLGGSNNEALKTVKSTAKKLCLGKITKWTKTHINFWRFLETFPKRQQLSLSQYQ